MKLHIAKLHLSAAADDAALANHYALPPFNRIIAANSARDSLVQALAGVAAGAGVDAARAALADTISQAITDTIGADWRPEHAAGAVIDAILDACLPLPKDESDD